MSSPQRFDGREGEGGGIVAPARPKRRSRLDGWPPFGWKGFGGDGGGDDGGGGDGGRGDYDPYEGHPRPGVSSLALALALICICTLFLMFLLLALLLWKTSPTWPPPGAPEPPKGLWVSTLILIGCSATLGRALTAHRRGEVHVLWNTSLASAGLGLAFLVAQALLWHGILRSGAPSSNGYVALFYMLTGLHALHILGGLFFLGRVIQSTHAAQDKLGPEAPLRLVGVYWHVMGVIWVALFAVLYFLP